MIPKECKRLAEVDFPIAVVSQHSAREKSIRQGNPSTLHLWWARRPLAACRSMLLGLLLPDPCDPACPDEFRLKARKLLPRVQGTPGSDNTDLRNELLRFIGDFANWDNSSKVGYVDAARGLVRAAYGDEPPLVVDPFSGGGSIPTEALRVGCDTYATDLNPVACQILKSMLVEIPQGGRRLASDLRKFGEEVKATLESELSALYPADKDRRRPIAYLWARTINCDSCGAEIPLVRSLWLTKNPKRKRALKPSVIRAHGCVPKLQFEVFAPKSDGEVKSGTVSRAKATCLCCNVVMPPERVRTQLRTQKGGANPVFNEKGNRISGARLLAVVVMYEGTQGREYRVAEEHDYLPVLKSQQLLQNLKKHRLANGLAAVPDEPTPAGGGSGAGRAFSIQNYGMMEFGDLFTARQLVTLTNICKHVSGLSQEHLKTIAGCVVSRCADFNSSLTSWSTSGEFIRSTFGRQALPIVWDFTEAVPWTDSSGNFTGAIEWVAAVIEEWPEGSTKAGQVNIADACESPLPTGSGSIWFTDPPYYDAIPYSDLADYFYVWLKRALPPKVLFRDPFDSANNLSPKDREAVQDETKMFNGEPKDRSFFESRMATAFAEGRRVLEDDGAACVVFAHKTTEGWEALLSGMVKGGWVITGSWPISTERPGRLRSQDSAALATSVHLICRPRPDNAGTGDWSDVLRELTPKVGEWIERLQKERIRGADLVFACIGPAMEIYSRYSRVEDAEGREIPLGGEPTAIDPYKRGFLAYVWETVGRLALEEVLGTAEARARNGAAGALEEDARLTALFLWTLQTTEGDSVATGSSEGDDEAEEEEDESKPQKKKTGYNLIYDVARRFAQPLGIHLDKWEGRIIETEKGIVRLMPVGDRASQLFGEADAAAISRRIEADVKASRNYSFAFMQDVGAAPQIKTRGRGRKGSNRATTAVPEAPAPQPVTTLDRLHAAMLLQRGGQTNGLRAMLREETQRGPDFLRLANALSRLYPKDSEEKRLLDAMLLAVPRN
jgi:putative DNA methylase